MKGSRSIGRQAARQCLKLYEMMVQLIGSPLRLQTRVSYHVQIVRNFCGVRVIELNVLTAVMNGQLHEQNSELAKTSKSKIFRFMWGVRGSLFIYSGRRKRPGRAAQRPGCMRPRNNSSNHGILSIRMTQNGSDSINSL